MAPQRVAVAAFGQPRFDGCPDGISHFGVEGADDGCDLHLVVVWVHPTAQSGQDNDRWMVTYVSVTNALVIGMRTYSRAS